MLYLFSFKTEVFEERSIYFIPKETAEKVQNPQQNQNEIFLLLDTLTGNHARHITESVRYILHNAIPLE